MLVQYCGIGQEASFHAAMLSKGNINIAQHLISRAESAPPVCRDLLTSSNCYKFDCPFSHDLENHTCSFWMKGRCRKSRPDECKFLHGFSDLLLQGLFHHDNDDAALMTNTIAMHHSAQQVLKIAFGQLQFQLLHHKK